MIRKKLRLNNFNYSSENTYFITICTLNRKNILSTFYVTNKKPPILTLSKYGNIIEKNIKKIEECYKNIKIDKYVIMPNHIHFIITNLSNISIPNIIRTFKTLTTKEIGYSIFQRSYNDHIIRNKYDYEKIYNYIEYNPINWIKDIYFN